MITSNQNSRIKLVRALAGRPKERREAGAFLAEGVRLVGEAHTADWQMRFVLYSDELSERGRELLKKLEAKSVEIEEVKGDLFRSMSDTETPQGILAVLDEKALPIPKSLNLILIPDQIRDPGNLGTLLRTADAAGVQAVLVPPETTDGFAPKVLRAGMGAHFRLPILSESWDEIRQVTQGMQVFLADMEGKSCWDMDLRAPLALIIGGEAEGASEQAQKMATGKISIPMKGKTESLNAAAAGAVLMFEVMRQRKSR